MWVLGVEDEIWWSRLALPSLSRWVEGEQPLRLIEQGVAQHDPEPKAFACSGLVVRWAQAGRGWHAEAWLRFVDGRPVSASTTQLLAWCCTKLAAGGKEALLVVWDHASWYVSRAVDTGLCEHNGEVKRTGRGVRIVACALPTKSPWLHPIEPKRAHSTQRVVEPVRLLPAEQLTERFYAFGCPHQPQLAIPKKVA